MLMKKILFLLCLSVNVYGQIEPSEYPVAKMDTVKDVYFGTAVSDPYRWLENDSLAATQEWLGKELELSFKYLHKLKNKYRPSVQLKINSYSIFSNIINPASYYFDFLYAKGEIFKYKIDKKDKVEITDCEVSEDNNHIAFSIAHSGSDWNEIYVMSCHFPYHKMPDVLKGMKFINIAWHNEGFFYTAYPQKGNLLKEKNENPSIYYHKLGTEQGEDILLFHDPAHPDGLIYFHSISKGKYLIIYNQYINKDNKPEQQVFTVDFKNSSFFKLDTLIFSKQKASFHIIGIYKNKFLTSTTLNAPAR